MAQEWASVLRENSNITALNLECNRIGGGRGGGGGGGGSSSSSRSSKQQEQQQPLSRVERVRSSSTYPVGAVDIDPDSRRQVNRGYVAISRPVQHRRCPVGRRRCLHGRVRVCAVVWERDMMLSCYAICTC